MSTSTFLAKLKNFWLERMARDYSYDDKDVDGGCLIIHEGFFSNFFVGKMKAKLIILGLEPDLQS
jgi:hypothetical protein